MPTSGESACWFVTYKMLNATGQKVCCPFPVMVIVSTIVKITAGMVARVATTLICLGYGIVRPSLSWPEIFVVSGLGLCYFVAVGSLEISQIVNRSDGDASPPAVWEFLVVVTNLCFGGWIFTSLALTRKNLAAFGQVRACSSSGCEWVSGFCRRSQPYGAVVRLLFWWRHLKTAKLRMYACLSHVLYAYVLISFLLMATEGAVYVLLPLFSLLLSLSARSSRKTDSNAMWSARYSGSVMMDWQHIWLIWAANRLLMFSILVVITILWRPRATSLLYAEMDEVPSQELDSPRSNAFGVELTRRIESAADSPTAEETKVKTDEAHGREAL